MLGTSFTSVRSVVNGVFRFVNGNRLKSLESNEANGNDGIAAMCLDGGEADSLTTFPTCIDNMNFVYPDIFSGRDSFNVFYEFCVAENLAYGAVFVSNQETCRICNGNLTIVGGSKDVIVYYMTRGNIWVHVSQSNVESANCRSTMVFSIIAEKGYLIRIVSGLWQMFNTPIVRFVPILLNFSHCSPYS